MAGRMHMSSEIMPSSPGDRKASKVLERGIDEAKRFPGSRFLGDNVGHRSTG